jgi:hypothetical protein
VDIAETVIRDWRTKCAKKSGDNIMIDPLISLAFSVYSNKCKRKECLETVFTMICHIDIDARANDI